MLNIFKKRGKSPKAVLNRLLDDYELPSFPSVVMGVLSMLRNAESSLEEISMQLELDPGMHVKVLRTANSAAFGLSAKVANIPHAIALLGRSRLESLVLSIAVKRSLPSADSPSFDANHFWFTSAKRASLARALARHLHAAVQPESFTAGLLQDIAVPVLVAIKKEEYCTVYRQWQNSENTSLDVMEKEAFGFDHTTVGAMMVQKWNLPEYLGQAIATHHRWDADIDVPDAVRLVSCIRDCNNDDTDKVIQTGKERFGMDHHMLQELAEVAHGDAERFAQILK